MDQKHVLGLAEYCFWVTAETMRFQMLQICFLRVIIKTVASPAAATEYTTAFIVGQATISIINWRIWETNKLRLRSFMTTLVRWYR